MPSELLDVATQGVLITAYEDGSTTGPWGAAWSELEAVTVGLRLPPVGWEAAVVVTESVKALTDSQLPFGA